MTITPADAEVTPGGSVSFAATVTGAADGSVAWTVDGAAAGTIDPSGNYVAPETEGTYTISAASTIDRSAMFRARARVLPRPPAAAPVIDPISKTSQGPVSATVGCPYVGSLPYVTLDGSKPTTASTQTSSVTLSASGTLAAICAGGGYGASPVTKATYTVLQPGASAPALSPVSGTWVGPMTVTIACATAGSAPFYTVDGSTPTTSSRQSGSVALTSPATVKAICGGAGFTSSTVAAVTYAAAPAAASPTFSPGGGSGAAPLTVAIVCPTAGTLPYRTVDGSAPSVSSQQSAVATLTGSGTVRAICAGASFAPSPETSVAYVVSLATAAAPSISPSSTTSSSPLTATITCATSGTLPYRTTDGSAPTTGSPQSGTATFTSTGTLRAICAGPGYVASVERAATFTINTPPPVAAAPKISPGTSTSSTTVVAVVSCPVMGTLPYVTTDGSTPTTSSSQSGTVTFTASGTLNAICAGPGYTQSAVASATYTIGSAPGSRWVTAAGAACTNGPGAVPSSQACEWQACKDDPLPSVVYYVCSTGGDDTRSASQAQSPSTPWATVAKAVSFFRSGLQPGQAIAFCRGGTFSGGGLWQNTSGSASNPFIVRDYTRPGRAGMGDPRPIFTGKLDDYITPGNVKFENIAVQVRAGLVGAFIYKTVSDITLCNVEFSGGGIGVQLGNDGDPREASNIQIVGSRFLQQSEQGFLGCGPNLLVDHNYFSGIPTNNTPLNHSIYVSGDSLNHPDWIIYNERISNNEIHPVSGSAQGALVMHGIHSGVTVEGNYLAFDLGAPAQASGWGLAIGGNGYAPRLEYVENAVMRGNTVINAGNYALGVATCKSNCLIENNLVVNTQQGSTGIGAPGELALNSNPVSTGITVRNNSVYLTAGGSIGIRSGLEGSGHRVVNNVVQVSGTCYGWQGSTSAYVERDYNASYGCSDAVVGGRSWKADPRWMSAGSDFRPASGSPLAGAGESSQSPAQDLDGTARPSPPSIGAFEP